MTNVYSSRHWSLPVVSLLNCTALVQQAANIQCHRYYYVCKGSYLQSAVLKAASFQMQKKHHCNTVLLCMMYILNTEPTRNAIIKLDKVSHKYVTHVLTQCSESFNCLLTRETIICFQQESTTVHTAVFCCLDSISGDRIISKRLVSPHLPIKNSSSCHLWGILTF